MKLKARLSILAMLAVALLVTVSCSGGQQNTAGTKPNPSANNAKKGTITADPNPIKVCDGSGLGITKLTFSADGPSVVEVRVSSPDGGLLSHTGPASTATTGKWVSNGSVFYLQDVSGGKPLTAENTITTLTVGVTSEGCE